MKKIFFILSAIIGISVLINSCTTDFDLTADYKEIMVVYGLLNQTEEYQYVRIHKAYVDEETSALVIANNPDSLYYPNILNVTVTESTTNKVYQLERVNGDTLGLAKAEGVFASSPNILYRFKGNLNPNYTYTLRAENKNTGYTVTATTPLVQDFNVSRPFPGIPVSMVSSNNYLVIWTVGPNSRIYDLYVTMNYAIATKSNPNVYIDTQSITWRIFKNRNYLGPEAQFDIDGKAFYQFVQDELDPLPDHVRILQHLDFTFYAGTEVLSNYVNFSEVQNGITGNNATAQYTNVDNGLGIFAARYVKQVTEVVLSTNSIDTLACGSKTGNLNFAPYKDLNKYPSWPSCN